MQAIRWKLTPAKAEDIMLGVWNIDFSLNGITLSLKGEINCLGSFRILHYCVGFPVEAVAWVPP